MQNLCQDVLCYIFRFLPEKELFRIKYVCKSFYNSSKRVFEQRYNKNFLSHVYKKSFLSQSYLIQHIENVIDNYKYIQCKSPVGTGKTAVALYFALRYNACIVVNTRILTTWFDEVNKWNLYHKDPQKSKVIFAHLKVNSSHMKYYKNMDKLTDKIVIVTIQSLKHIAQNYIVDEAHLIKKCQLNFTRNANKILLFSASDIYNPYGKIHKIEYKPFMLTEHLHNIGGKYAKIEYKYLKSNLTKIQRDLTFFIQKYNKIVVFCDVDIKELRRFIKTITIKDTIIIVFSNSAKTYLNKFREHNCVFFCTYRTAIEGVNFSEAECMLCYNLHTNSCEKTKHCFGRVKRLNNVKNYIPVYIAIEPEILPIQYILSRLNKIYVEKNLIFLNKKPQSIMNYIISELGKEKLRKLNDQEMLALFSQGSYNFENFKTDIPMDKFLSCIYRT